MEWYARIFHFELFQVSSYFRLSLEIIDPQMVSDWGGGFF